MAGFAFQRAFSILTERPLCDACLAPRAGIPVGRVARALRRWIGWGHVVRERGQCSSCHAARLVSRVAARSSVAEVARGARVVSAVLGGSVRRAVR